jgi:hypothetical protein
LHNFLIKHQLLKNLASELLIEVNSLIRSGLLSLQSLDIR